VLDCRGILDLPRDKRVEIGLTYIFRNIEQLILKNHLLQQAAILLFVSSCFLKVNNDDTSANHVESTYQIEGDLRRYRVNEHQAPDGYQDTPRISTSTVWVLPVQINRTHPRRQNPS
jgi:hypothetical protein